MPTPKFIVAILGFILTAQSMKAESDLPPGVAIEEVNKGTALSQAGIQAGDVILYWEGQGRSSSPDGRKPISSPFDWSWLEIEQAPRGFIKLFGLRGDQDIIFTISRGPWESLVCPRFKPNILALCMSAERFAKAHNYDEAERSFAEVARNLRTSDNIRNTSWIFMREADIWVEAKNWGRAISYYRLALKFEHSRL